MSVACEGQWPDRNQTCPRKPLVCVLDRKSYIIFCIGCRGASQGLGSINYFQSCRHTIDVAMGRAPPRCQLTHAVCANLVDPSEMLLLLPHWNSMELSGATLSHFKGGATIMVACRAARSGSRIRQAAGTDGVVSYFCLGHGDWRLVTSKYGTRRPRSFKISHGDQKRQGGQPETSRDEIVSERPRSVTRVR